MSNITRPITVHDLVVRYYTNEKRPMTIAEISKELGIGRETVREHLIRAGVPRRAQKARGSRDETMMAEAARRYLDSETLWSIANDLGKTATTVRAWLIDAGVERRRPGVSIDGESLHETIRLYESGLTIEEVAAEQSMHPWTVRKRLVTAGVPRRARGRRAQRRADSANMPLVSADAALAQIANKPAIEDVSPLRSEDAALDAFWCTQDLEDFMVSGCDEMIVGGSLDNIVLQACADYRDPQPVAAR